MNRSYVGDGKAIEATVDRAAEPMRLLTALVESRPNHTFPGNAPGHCHENPPYWDGTGGRCDWCTAWLAAKTWLEANA